MGAPVLCVVMPVYNEAACVETVIEAWIKALSDVIPADFLLIVRDDGSNDGTDRVLSR